MSTLFTLTYTLIILQLGTLLSTLPINTVTSTFGCMPLCVCLRVIVCVCVCVCVSQKRPLEERTQAEVGASFDEVLTFSTVKVYRQC